VERIERFRDKLTTGGLSNDSVRRIVTTLGYTLKLARKWRLIAHNPVSDADKPTTRRRTPSLPSLEDVERLAKTMPDRETSALVLFAAFSGARKSECFALRWTDVDLTPSNETVRIVRRYYKGELVEQTKSLAGARETLLAPPAADALRELSVAQQLDERPNPHGLVFPSPRGSYWRDSNFDRRVWQKTRVRAKLPNLTFHTLRYFSSRWSAPWASRPRSPSDSSATSTNVPTAGTHDRFPAPSRLSGRRLQRPSRRPRSPRPDEVVAPW
jgi:integrase